MQYKIMWLVTVEYIYAGLWEYFLIVKVQFWHLSEYWVQSYICCGKFHNLSGQFRKTCVVF